MRTTTATAAKGKARTAFGKADRRSGGGLCALSSCRILLQGKGKSSEKGKKGSDLGKGGKARDDKGKGGKGKGKDKGKTSKSKDYYQDDYSYGTQSTLSPTAFVSFCESGHRVSEAHSLCWISKSVECQGKGKGKSSYSSYGSGYDDYGYGGKSKGKSKGTSKSRLAACEGQLIMLSCHPEFLPSARYEPRLQILPGTQSYGSGGRSYNNDWGYEATVVKAASVRFFALLVVTLLVLCC